MNLWQQRRSEFNHDWLKNRFLNRLNAFIERLQTPSPDAQRLARFVAEDLPEWKSHEPEARWLIESVEQEMSPRCFFDYSPLSKCSEQTKSWLPDVVHEIWAKQYSVQSLQTEARKLLLKVNQQYELLKRELSQQGKRGAAGLMSLRPQFFALSQACAELHDAFSAFDREIKFI
ncbi:MAG: hypothetical protein C4586_07660 [Anaerolineaceae bacterium]|nr:MAG: hypothetical protein C4586_07660 [Anaerolineaceae bacterium]